MMPTRSRRSLLALSGAMALGLSHGAVPRAWADGPAPTVAVRDAWARPTAGGTTTGAIYLTLTGTGGANMLTAASTPAADMAMLHTTIDDQGVMRMRMLDSVKLEPGQPVRFRPGGLHIMLEGLHEPLKAGQTVPLTLTFSASPPITISVPVGSPPPGSGTQ